jgi:rhodanese-related sulfurtransferase
MCQSGLRSYIASRILMGNGFDVYNFAGGFRYYDTVHNDKALNKKSTPCGMDE